jgi:DNA-binding NarL/FixJ family response regulator
VDANNIADKPPTILIVDDHALILEGTVKVIRQQYPEAEIITVKTAEEVLNQLAVVQPDLVIVDLSIPEKAKMPAESETGIKLLSQLMQNYPNLNLMVQSSNVKTLVRLKSEIEKHEGGFTIADKSISESEMLYRAKLALEGITHTKDLKLSITLKPEWLTLLELANQGWQDGAIAQKMFVTPRMVRHHWTKVQDLLGVYPDEDSLTNLRVTTLNCARQQGFID